MRKKFQPPLRYFPHPKCYGINFYILLLAVTDFGLPSFFPPFSNRLYVGAILQSLRLISIIAVHFDLMINQIMHISREFSETFSSVKVYVLRDFSFFFPFRFPYVGQLAELISNVSLLPLDLLDPLVVIYLFLILFPGFQFDYVFDWTILKYQQSQLSNPRALVSDIII